MSYEVKSLRLPESMAKQLRSIAQADGVDVPEVLRQAIENHITARLSRDEFKERLAKRLEEDREVLDALADPDEPLRLWRRARAWLRNRARRR